MTEHSAIQLLIAFVTPRKVQSLMPARQILSSPTLLDFGCYDYFELTLEGAIEWLSRGEYFCTIRSRDMCHALHELSQRNIYPLYGAPTPPLNPGEEALVYYVMLSDSVRSVSQMDREYMKTHYQLGLLKRVDGMNTSSAIESNTSSGSLTEHS